MPNLPPRSLFALSCALAVAAPKPRQVIQRTGFDPAAAAERE